MRIAFALRYMAHPLPGNFSLTLIDLVKDRLVTDGRVKRIRKLPRQGDSS
jgi:hypothetical protein